MKIDVELTPSESNDLLLMLGIASGFLAGSSGGMTDGNLNRMLALVNKLNAHNPDFTPYELVGQ